MVEGNLEIRFGDRVILGLIAMKRSEIYIEAREFDSEISVGDHSAIMNACELVARSKNLYWKIGFARPQCAIICDLLIFSHNHNAECLIA